MYYPSVYHSSLSSCCQASNLLIVFYSFDRTTFVLPDVNKQLQKLHSESDIICIPDLEDITQTTLILYSDTSDANLSNCASQGGFVIFLCGKSGKSSPLAWRSHQLKSVVKRSMAAETVNARRSCICSAP